ncbi:MAG TPA: zf-HC2 domain-containing protein [Pyrinomonadaceae bacterium]|jgi:hypothetical protein
MRCEDCLPLIEEYFDGEVTTQTGASVRAHLSACADCSAALDALSFEQEVYARYDRGGLEVSPDLWARVSAEIARTPPPSESPAAGDNFLSRARAYFAAALGTLAARPALASSLALLLVSATVGTLWLSRKTPTANAPSEVAAGNAPAPKAAVKSTVPDNAANGGEAVTAGGGSRVVDEGELVAAAESLSGGRARVAAGGQESITITQGVAAAEDDIERLLATPSAPPSNPNIVVIQPDGHEGEETAADIVDAGAPAGAFVAQASRPLDPEEKDVARHVERAQMLLRSIKNVRASEMADADITYEKDLSRRLLAENATLQLEAEVKGDKESKQVLDQIEPFLLEIANMGEKPSRDEVRSIRERVKKDEIVAALQVY